MRLWPRTLGVQLIVVISLAIFLSNAAVALWFELGAERMNEADIVERMLDRTTSLSTLMASIPPRARAAAAEAMEGRYWRYHIHSGAHVDQPMSPEETKLAARLKAMVPAHHANGPVEVHLHYGRPPGAAPGDPAPATNWIEMTVPVVRGTELIATFIKPPGPPWPMEMIMAAVLAVLIASVSGAYIARRMARPLSKLAEAAALTARGETAPRILPFCRSVSLVCSAIIRNWPA